MSALQKFFLPEFQNQEILVLVVIVGIEILRSELSVKDFILLFVSVIVILQNPKFYMGLWRN